MKQQQQDGDASGATTTNDNDVENQEQQDQRPVGGVHLPTAATAWQHRPACRSYHR